MKKLLLSTFAAALVFAGLSISKVHAANAAAIRIINTNALIVQFQISSIVAASTNISTNAIGEVTQVVVGTRTDRLTSADILRMLAIQLGTTLPSGSQIAYGISGPHRGFQIVSRQGIFLADVSDFLTLSTNVLNSTNAPPLTSGKISFNSTNDVVGSILTTLTPNTAIFYKDDHGNDFNFIGLMTTKENGVRTLGSSVDRALSFTIVGTGGGTYLQPKTLATVQGVFSRAQAAASGRNIRRDD